MKLAMMILCAALLGGCATTEPQEVVTKNVFLIPKLPDEATQVPAQVRAPDLATATQKDVAKWMADSEKRVIDLETKVKSYQNLMTLMIEKNGLKDGDYRFVEFDKDEVLAPKNELKTQVLKMKAMK